MNSYSKVEYLSLHKGYHCGYCKSSNTSYSHGMWAHSLSVEDYQNLIDRGWRRSGMYCYKPEMTRTCCPSYTIRCEALNLKLTKSQKKILKKMAKYLKDGVKSGHKESDHEPEGGDNLHEAVMLEKVAGKFKNNEANEIINLIDESVRTERKLTDEQSNVIPAESSCTDITDSKIPESPCEPEKEINVLKTPRPGLGMDPTKGMCKKAKILRFERKQQKLQKQQEEGKMEISKSKQQKTKEKVLEDFIKEGDENSSVNRLELRLVRSSPASPELETTFEESYLLYTKYQTIIHKDKSSECTRNGFVRFLIRSPLQIRMIPANSDEKALKDSWLVFVKYQRGIHNEKADECCYDTFEDFLITTPLQVCKEDSGPPNGYGSFHQQYWLNGKLIAVGVLDVLPKCVSSVYFFYDPDYSFLSLGTYGSLRELELVRSYANKYPELKYYYMGFYIHTCPKMRYKARLIPSYLLCPEVYTWHSAETSISKLDINKYSRLNDDQNVKCENSIISLNQVLVLWQHTVMRYSVYKVRSECDDDEEVQEYAELVGNECSKNVLLFRQ